MLSECRLEEEKEYKIEDIPKMFRRVIFTCEQPYCKINYKYERCKHTKLNLATKIFPVDSFVVLFSSFFLFCGDLKCDLMFLIQLI